MDCKTLSFILLFKVALLSSKPEFLSTKVMERHNNLTLHDTARNLNIKLLNTTQKRKGLTTYSPFQSHKKWLIERVTKKHYEVFNVLWQKTKIFVDLDYSDWSSKTTTTQLTSDLANLTTTVPNSMQYPIKSPISIQKQQSKPSYMEFYYLDYNTHNNEKPKQPTGSVSQKLISHNKLNANQAKRKKSPSPSLYKIRVNTVPRKNPLISLHQEKSVHKIYQSNLVVAMFNKSKSTNLVNKISPTTVYSKSNIRERKKSNHFRLEEVMNIFPVNVPVTAATERYSNKSFTNKNNNLSLNLYFKNIVNGTKSSRSLIPTSTVYDRVKFFETYDSNTPKIHNYSKRKRNTSNIIDDDEYDNEPSNTSGNEQIDLHDVNVDTGHEHDEDKSRYVKKHIQNTNKDNKSGSESNAFMHPNRQHVKISLNTTKSVPFQKHSNGSRMAAWSEFPFVAVYIYEPLQVRCDAAGLTPHWLVAAASCLSRYQRELHGGSLSAFVIFCSDNWRNPQKMSYVKRTVIHPRYHPKERMRRHLYNAGMVQVVNSMADTCTGWAPVSLISYQFTADQKGSTATTVGWGLDRYDSRTILPAPNTPRYYLMLYEGLVYSQLCPRNFKYSVLKTSEEDDVNNVYCLSLPPFSAESNHTVHGALLLIGEKLMALYLQEERFPSGVQTAQYTGLWGLIPWLTETAQEPEDYTFLDK